MLETNMWQPIDPKDKKLFTSKGLVQHMIYQYERQEHPEEKNYSPEYVRVNLISLPLYRIKKDLVDTVKPYKTFNHFMRDLLYQPFYGIGNIFRSLDIVLGGSRGASKTLLLASGLLYLGRGLGQIFSWPLTLVFRIPLRGLVTLINGMPWLEDSKGIHTLISEYDHASDHYKRQIESVLLQRFYKAQQYHQATKIDITEVKEISEEAEGKISSLIESVTQCYANPPSIVNISRPPLDYSKIHGLFKQAAAKRDEEKPSFRHRVVNMMLS